MASTLTAGDFLGLGQGYYSAYGVGSLSPDAFGGFTCTALVTGATPGSISAYFSGDATAFLAGKAISVNGTAYSTITSGPTYDSGAGTTSIEWTYGPGNFTVGNSYSIDIGAGGPASPNITSPSTVPNLIGTKLAHTITADKTIASTAITGGADAAEFEINGTAGLRFAGDANSDTAGSYVVEVTVTDTDGLTVSQTITVPVKYILYVGGKTWSRAGATSTTNVSLTDLTGGIASAPAEGDYVIVHQGIGSNADRAVATTSGYTELSDIYANGTTYDANLGVDAKFMTSTPDTTVTIGSSGSSNDAQAARIMVFRGVDQTNPMDVAVVTATGTGTGKPDPGALTPATTGAVGVFSGAQAAATAAALTSSDLTAFASVNQADTNDIAVAAGYIEWSGSGAINPAAFGGGSSNSANSWAAVSLALRPAYSAGGGPTTYNESLTESTTPAQSATTAATFQSAASESVTSAASQAVGLSAPVTLSESATVSDSATAALVHQPTLSESVTTSEASANAATFAPTLTESASASESSATAATFTSSASESVTSADNAASAATFLSAVSETIAANDNGAPAASITASLDEAVAPDDAATATHVAQASLSEAVSADASAEPAATIGASLDESIEAGEESTASVDGGAVTYDETLSEAVGLADDASTSATLTAARSETVSSSVTQSVSAVLAAVRSESVTVADVAQGASIIGASVSEDAGVSVAQSVAAIFAHALAEPVAANDDEAAALAIDEALSEDVGSGDGYEVEGGNRIPVPPSRSVTGSNVDRDVAGSEPPRHVFGQTSPRHVTGSASDRQLTAVTVRRVAT